MKVRTTPTDIVIQLVQKRRNWQATCLIRPLFESFVVAAYIMVISVNLDDSAMPSFPDLITKWINLERKKWQTERLKRYNIIWFSFAVLHPYVNNNKVIVSIFIKRKINCLCIRPLIWINCLFFICSRWQNPFYGWCLIVEICCFHVIQLHRFCMFSQSGVKFWSYLITRDLITRDGLIIVHFSEVSVECCIEFILLSYKTIFHLSIRFFGQFLTILFDWLSFLGVVNVLCGENSKYDAPSS